MLEVQQLLSTGQHAAAENLLKEVLKQNPDHRAALRLTGIIHHRVGRLDQAAAVFKHKHELNPASLGDRIDLSNVLLELGRNDEVLALLGAERIAGAAAAAAWFNRARAFKQLGRTDEAIAPLRAALALQPDHAGALMVLGDALKAMGESGEAAACYRSAIRLKPDNGVAWWSLSNLKSDGFSDSEFSALKQRAAAGSPPQQQVYFDFALARAFEDREDYDNAFSAYQRANRFRRQQQPWNATGFSTWLAQLHAGLDGLPIPPRTDSPGTPRPVFIVSLPRSGSTLTEQILAAHPAVTAASELPWIPNLLAEESKRRGEGINHWSKKISEGEWLSLGEDYLQKSAWWHRDTPLFTDKLPGNFVYIGAILKMLPNALIVNVRRNAKDVCLSCYRQLFIRGQEFSYDLADLAAYWKDYDRHMTYWRKRAPDQVYDVEYESLVLDPETEIRRLLQFLELEWDPGCLRFHEARRAVNTASAAQVRKGLNTRGINYWQRYADHLDELVLALDDAG
jgi:tetratricopeptide (TPR) repeat protein